MSVLVKHHKQRNKHVFSSVYLGEIVLETNYNDVRVIRFYYTISSYTRKNLTTCSKSTNKLSTSCVCTACYKLSTSLEQAVDNL